MAEPALFCSPAGVGCTQRTEEVFGADAHEAFPAFPGTFLRYEEHLPSDGELALEMEN